MRLVCTKRMRRHWRTHTSARNTILLERDLSIRGSGLKAKLLVFKTRRDLRRFWVAINPEPLGRTCMGAVTSLQFESFKVDKNGREYSRRIEADRRYFCLIGLVKGFLSAEIVSHEAVHAGFAFAKRVKRSPWDEQSKHFDEEAVCYPAGNITSEINAALHDAGLY